MAIFDKFKGMLNAGNQPVESGSLLKDKQGRPVGADLHVLIFMLLIQAASADNDVAKEEADSICNLAEHNLGMHPDSIPQMVQNALALRTEKRRMEDYVSPLNDRFDTSQRVRILAMVWKIVLSDNKLERSEERAASKAATLLRLSPDEQELARRMAEDGKV